MNSRYGWMLHPAQKTKEFYEWWSTLIGKEYAARQRTVFVTMMVSGAVMVLGCIVAFTLALAVGVESGSLQQTLVAMWSGGILVIGGYIVLQMANQRRLALIAEKAVVVQQVDPQMTQEKAQLLMTQPQILRVWLTKHPGAFDSE